MSKNSYVSLVIVFAEALLAGCVASAQQPAAAIAKASPGSRSGRIALLVGINRYQDPSVPALGGCLNDVEQMKDLLIGKYEFEDSDILVLRESDATRAAILQALQEHLIRHAKDKIVVFHFSGHGSQMADDGGDEDDQWDETLVPYDSRTPNIFDISDDELNGLLSQLSGVAKSVTAILDCCHSGTATRGLGVARQAPRDERRPPAQAAFARGDARAGRVAASLMEVQGCTVISACRSDELAYEYGDEHGAAHGALTHFLTREIKTAGQETTYRDVMDKVQARVTAVKPHQHPVLSGGQADNFVFDIVGSLAQPYVVIGPVEDKFILNAGQAQGVTAGSRYRVFPPGAKQFDDPAAGLASVEITSVDPYHAEAKLSEGQGFPESSRAIEIQHQYGKNRVQVYLDKTTGGVTEEIAKLISSGEKIDASNSQSPTFADVFAVVDKPDMGMLFVRQDAPEVGGPLLISISTGDGATLSPAIASDAAGAGARTAAQLVQWAKWFRTLMIENQQSTLKVDFRIARIASPTGGTNDSDDGLLRLVEGEKVIVTVENQSDAPIYFAILDFGSDGSISVLYPPLGRSEALGPNPLKPWSSGPVPAIVPVGRETVRDHIKLIATQTPIDFRFLQQGAISGERGGDDPLAQLIAGSQLMRSQTRGPRVATDRWTTRVKCMEVTRVK